MTLDPAGAYAIASALLPVLAECGAEAIAGPTLGADPIVSAVAAVSHAEGRPVSGAIVRKEAKGHGGGRMIEGPLRAGARVAVVDDACTSGASLFHAIDAVEAAGCRVVKVIAVLDRREGGSDEIRRRGYDFLALLQATDQGHIGPVEGDRPHEAAVREARGVGRQRRGPAGRARRLRVDRAGPETGPGAARQARSRGVQADPRLLEPLHARGGDRADRLGPWSCR